MKYLDLSFDNPKENLACDEALIDQCEDLDEGGILRFWESQQHFVVVGYSNVIENEVNEDSCTKENIPILRRCTGGGTVVQGPGCLNYCLVLRISDNSPLATVTEANTFVMDKHKDVFTSLLGRSVEVKGHTDLALEGLKFSGNAQRRKRTFLLFHGTFLLDFDFQFVERALRFPSKHPSYRKNRSHQEFLMNLKIPANPVKKALREAWNALEPLDSVPTERIEKLVAEHYGCESWISRS